MYNTAINDMLKNVTTQDMPSEDMRLVAETCGINVAIKLMKGMGGTAIYIPKHPYFKLVEKIIKEFDNINYKEVALAFGVTERHVRNIWRQNRAKEKQFSFLNKLS